MPVLDSFKVDHTKMIAPAIRYAKTIESPKGEIINVYDLRFCKPNDEMMPAKGLHTLEHLFAGFMRDYLDPLGYEIIDISPMGCRTGFYMSVIGTPTSNDLKIAWDKSMREVTKVISTEQIPELNVYQCGSYHYHSLDEAKGIAQKVIDRGIREMKNEDLELPDGF